MVRWGDGWVDSALGGYTPGGWECGKWLDPKGFWEGTFRLRQVVEPEPLAGAFWQVVRGITGLGWVRGMGSLLSETEKPRGRRGFFFFYSISSEYQAGGIKLPTFFE
jgi:hypothetical protein